jgi:PQQ-like domain
MLLRISIVLVALAVASLPFGGVAQAEAKRFKSVLKPGGRLDPGESLRSRGGRHRLVMQRDGNLVLYSRGKAAWSSQTEGLRGARAVMRRNGDLVVRAGQAPRFVTGSGGHRGARLRLQRDGNAVVYSARGRALWNSDEDRYVLGRNQFLRPGQVRRSPNGRYLLAMQTDGNLVLYDDESREPLWSAQVRSPGATAVMRADGQLVVLSDGAEDLFVTGTAGNPGARLAVQDDGNTVVYSKDGRGLWSTTMDEVRLGPGQTLRPGQWRSSWDGRYRLQMQSDGNLVLVELPSHQPLWSTLTGGQHGARATMQPDGNLVLYSAAGQPLWQTGTQSAGAVLDVQTDGNVVVYAADGRPLWSSRGG